MWLDVARECGGRGQSIYINFDVMIRSAIVGSNRRALNGFGPSGPQWLRAIGPSMALGHRALNGFGPSVAAARRPIGGSEIQRRPIDGSEIQRRPIGGSEIQRRPIGGSEIQRRLQIPQAAMVNGPEWAPQPQGAVENTVNENVDRRDMNTQGMDTSGLWL